MSLTNSIIAISLDSEDKNDDFYSIATAVRVLHVETRGDITLLLLQGLARIRIGKIVQKRPHIMAEVEVIVDNTATGTNQLNEALKNVSLKLFKELDEKDIDPNLSPSEIADTIADKVVTAPLMRQKILATIDIQPRFEILNQILADLINQMKLEDSIRNTIQLKMSETQRKFYLREQLDAIRHELGEKDEVEQEIDKWKKIINEKDLPDYVEEVALEELGRMAMMQPASSEYAVLRNYIDWIVNLPWQTYSEDRLDIKKIEKILSMDHFGLEKAKERILEYIAVKKLKGSLNGPILCFVGPPGVGKTSIGKSVARALNRKFVRLSLGGIHDEAEIRGHRRTYIGALPGKILSELKRCGTANPVFMLDEIDKLGKDFRGDPGSALLEVLDPEQNNSFLDNYINLPFDLSEVMFITTANGLDTIPPPLLDRMEIIEFSSYVEEEKIEIAKYYLIPKEIEKNGLNPKYVKLSKTALQELCRYYVREAGVRNLQRRVGSIMRKLAKRVVEGDSGPFTITNNNVSEFLGTRRYNLEMSNRKPEIGVTTGLAWTQAGGEILFCEAIRMPGKGNIMLTGLLGDVMKESARIALSYLKAHYEQYGIEKDAFDNYDIHVHFPAGAVPKDGPSAGVTLTTTLASLFMQKRVKHDVAMTGEITLLGKVLPIGGVREKILAAKRAGIKQILLPEENKDSVTDLAKDIIEGLEITYVSQIDQILGKMLIP
jgi:ATP-dependent Lon protease